MPDQNDRVVENKHLVRTFVDAVNSKDWRKLEELVSPSFCRHSYAAGKPGIINRDQLIDFLRSEASSFPDGREELLDLVAEQDKVAARHVFSGTQAGPLGGFPASGNRMVVEYIAIYRIERGVLAEAWVEWDNLAGLRQLGHA